MYLSLFLIVHVTLIKATVEAILICTSGMLRINIMSRKHSVFPYIYCQHFFKIHIYVHKFFLIAQI